MNRDPRRVSDRIMDMLDAISYIADDLGGMTRDAFLSDGKTQRAVIESFIVLGEAAKRIMQMAPSLEHQNSSLWQQLRDAYDMRIILTHEYFRIDPSIVWTTAKESLPPLALLLRAHLDD